MDSSLLRKVNSKAVLAALRAHGRMGRRDIAELTNLSFPTVCRLVDELVGESIIAEVGSTRTDNARRRTVLLDIDPSGGWVVAMEVGGGHVRAAAMDLRGQLHESEEQPLENVQGEESVTPAIASTLARLIERCEPSRGKPLVIGISSAGMVDSEMGMVKLSFNLQLSNFPIARVAQQVCDVPAIVHDNIVSSTLAEAKLGHGRTHSSFAYIAVGVGMGGNFVVNRELYDLAAVSQFGLMLVAPEGDPDRFGGRGYLESLASGRGIAAAARRAIKNGTKSMISDLVPAGPAFVTAKDVADAARMGDTLANEIMVKATDYLGIAIVNIANLFGLTFFAINGGVSKSGDVFWNPLRDAVRRHEYWPGQIELEPSMLKEDAAVLGAGLLALDKAFDSVE